MRSALLYKIDTGSRFTIEKKSLDSIPSARSASVLVLPPVLEPRRRRPSPAGPASMPPPLPMRAHACRTCTPAYALRDQQPSPSSGRAGAASVRSRCVELRLRRPPKAREVNEPAASSWTSFRIPPAGSVVVADRSSRSSALAASSSSPPHPPSPLAHAGASPRGTPMRRRRRPDPLGTQQLQQGIVFLFVKTRPQA